MLVLFIDVRKPVNHRPCASPPIEHRFGSNLTNNEVTNSLKCNCRNKNLCPLDGKCLTSNFMYYMASSSNTINSHTTS